MHNHPKGGKSVLQAMLNILTPLHIVLALKLFHLKMPVKDSSFKLLFLLR